MNAKLLGKIGKMAMTKEQRKLNRIKEMQQEKDKLASAIEQGQDPFNTLGFGLIAYRNTLYSLFVVFLLCSLITYPVLNAFRAGDAI